MAAKRGGAQFIGGNRPPRVQIEYEVYRPEGPVSVQLPFVMGVMADLSGEADPPDEVPEAHQTARGELEKRKFLAIDAKNFNDRLKAMKPRVSFSIPQTLTDQGGEIEVDLTFESLDDFSPAGVARKVGALNKLLEARDHMKNLLPYCKGKVAKDLLVQLLQNPSLCEALKPPQSQSNE